MADGVETWTWPIISDDHVVQAHYEACREKGTSHNLAEMFALGEAPACNTDTTFLSGHCNGNQFEGQDEIADEYAREAAAAGVNVKGKVYIGGLASYPGDPEAWVDGKGDVERVARKRGYSVEGDVTVKPPERGGLQEVAVADDILDATVNNIVANVPEGARVDKVELREQVKAKRKPRWAK